MSDMTYTGNDDDFWEQWEKMTLHDQGMWALQHVLIAYVNKERDKERPVKLNHAVAVALGDLLDELRASVPVLETPAEAVFCDHSQWRECAATLEMVRDLSDKALNYTAAYDLANDLAAILAGYDDAIPGAPVEPVPAPRLECDHTTEFYDEAGDSTRVLWSEDVIGYNYCPDCGTLLSAPPVGTQPKGD